MDNNPMQTSHDSNPVPVNPLPINPPTVSNTNDGSAEGNDLDEFLKKMRPGYKFVPTEYELIACYLMRKIKKEELPLNKIHDVKLYDFSPEDLTESFEASEKNEWYFFTPRDKKYPKGKRPKRDAGNGYWKAISTDKAIKDENAAGREIVIGHARTLAYCEGKTPNGNKTGWLMNEYTVKDPPAPAQTAEDKMRLDDWVLCKIYKKRSSNPNNNNQNPEINQETADDTDDHIEEEVTNPTGSNFTLPLEEPRPHNETEAPNRSTSGFQLWNMDPSLRFFNPEDFNVLSVGFNGSHSIPFNQQVGRSGVWNYNFPTPVKKVPPVLPEPQNNITSRGFPQDLLNEILRPDPGSPNDELYGIWGWESNGRCIFDDVIEFCDTKMPRH